MRYNRYFAKDSPDTFERERLSLLTQIADPITTRRLNEMSVEPGWRCLDVGAGDGSVARWLAKRVGPEGRVVATDLNPRFLGGHELPNLEVRRHDILADDLEAEHYDLVHCRCVLQHLVEPLRALRRMVNAVRPGGWLFVEEVDGGIFGATDPEHPRAAEFNRTTRMLLDGLQTKGPIDTTFGRRVPALVERFGIQELAHDGGTLIARGGDTVARCTRMTEELLRDHLVAVGALTVAEFEERSRAYDDPSFWFAGYTFVGVWGRRPS
jgi:SAM-dependent methyltransferase